MMYSSNNTLKYEEWAREKESYQTAAGKRNLSV